MKTVMASVKSLQKLTDIKDKQTLDNYLSENPETDYDIIFEHISEKANSTLKKDFSTKWQHLAELLVYSAKKYGPVKTYENTRNSLYQWNHVSIIAALHKGIMECNMMPTITNIASETGLSRTSVHKHLKDVRDLGNDSEVRLQLGMMAEQAITRLYKIGMEDSNPTALKYFIQFADPTLMKSAINNYIQINNIRLSQEDIQSLPKSTIATIETLVKKSRSPALFQSVEDNLENCQQ